MNCGSLPFHGQGECLGPEDSLKSRALPSVVRPLYSCRVRIFEADTNSCRFARTKLPSYQSGAGAVVQPGTVGGMNPRHRTFLLKICC